MSALANILACATTDLITTPTSQTLINNSSNTVGYDRTFKPNGLIAPGVQEYVDRSPTFEAAYPRYTISVKTPAKGPRVSGQSRNIRIVEKITLPIANVTSPSTGSGIQPQPSIAGSLICNREYIIPEWALLADRKIFMSLCASFNSGYITAADGNPADSTGAPIFAAVGTSEQPY